MDERAELMLRSELLQARLTIWNLQSREMQRMFKVDTATLAEINRKLKTISEEPKHELGNEHE